MTGVRALFPLDGSDETYRAVQAGLQKLATMKDAQATFLVVLNQKLKEMPEDAREYLTYDDEDELFLRDDEAKAVLKKAQDFAKKAKFSRTAERVAEGRVYDAILAEAKRHDVLVMHRLKREERREKASGSITEKLCRNAPCDVWLVQTE